MFYGTARWKPSQMSILSVYPEERRVEMKHQGHTIYTIPGCDPNKIKIVDPLFSNPINDEQKEMGSVTEIPCSPGDGFVLLHIYDTVQFVKNHLTEQVEPRPIPVDVVGNDIEKVFGAGYLTIDGDQPTPEQLEAVRTSLNDKFLLAVQEANDHHQRGESAKIRHRHRVAAKWTGDESLPWVRAPKQRVQKDCIACGHAIFAQAVVCEHCGTNLVKFYSDMKIKPNETEDPAVYRLYMARKNVARKPDPSKPKPLSAMTRTERKELVKERLDEAQTEKQAATVNG